MIKQGIQLGRSGQARLTPKTYAPISYALLVLLVAFTILYIYGVNRAVVGSLTIQRAEEEKAALEEHLARLEAERVQISVGSSLEAKAAELGLKSGAPPRFLTKETLVAQVGF